MKEKFKQLKSIQNMMVLALLLLLSIFTTQTSAIAKNYAPLPQTGQTQSYAPGDDGDLRMGVQWPDPRFTDNGDGTVTDNLTGLIWLKNANCFATTRTWSEALTDCNGLASGSCGLTDGSSAGDWRLPNVKELQSLIDYGQHDPALPSGYSSFFTNVLSSSYWSSTSYDYYTNNAWHVSFEGGLVLFSVKSFDHSVWCVRGSTVSDELAVDFGAYGLWHYDGTTWTSLAAWDPEGIETWASGLAVDFGTFGLWNYDGSSWANLAGWNPTIMEEWSGGLAVDFDTYGVWYYDGSVWTSLAGWNAEGMEIWGSDLAADFGTYGLWNYDGSSWSNLAGWDPEDMIDVDLY